jgi:hypothetical protein
MFVGLLAAVALPLCGYVGVASRRRWLVTLFSFVSFFLSILFVSGFISSLIVYKGDPIRCMCDDDCSKEVSPPPGWEPSWICENPAKYRALWWTGMAFGIAMAALQCVGGVLGHRLSRHRLFFLVPSLGTTSGGWERTGP